MNETTASARYDKGLDNVALLEKYRDWLVKGGASVAVINQHRIPMAGHVLGLNLKPHKELNLTNDLEKAMAYVKAKQTSKAWTTNCRHSLNWFRRFLCRERGLVTKEDLPAFSDVSRFQEGLPAWLLTQLQKYLQIRQANWRQSRLVVTTYQFWHKHTRFWRWLFEKTDITEITNIRRAHVHDYMDEMLAQKYAVGSVNQELYMLQAFLRFLQQRGQKVPPTLLTLSGLKTPDSLPRFLTDEQVHRLRADLSQRAETANTPASIRDSRLDLATFYLLWQGGLRVCELEELTLADIDFSQKRLMVRRGKGMKDRTIYLTETAIQAIESYLEVRGPGQTDHLFLYRHKPLSKDLLRSRMKGASQRTGVKVTPHMLRHTFGTQLVNAGCKITTIQALLGHRRLHSTMIYARAHDQTVADDYYKAMAVIEKRLEPHLPQSQNSNGHNPNTTNTKLLTLIAALQTEPLTETQQAIVTELQQTVTTMTELPNQTPEPSYPFVNEPAMASP